MAKPKVIKPKISKSKISKTEAAPLRPVKETFTKSALINLIAEQNDIPRKTALYQPSLIKTHAPNLAIRWT